MATGEQGQEVPDGGNTMLPVTTTYLGETLPQQPLYNWDPAAQQSNPVQQPQGDVKLEEDTIQGGGFNSDSGHGAVASVPVSGECAVDETSYFVGEGSAGPVSTSVPPPQVLPAQQIPELSMGACASTAPVTMVTAPAAPMVLDVSQQPVVVTQPGGQALPTSATAQPLMVGPVGTVTLEELRSAVQQFAVERDWDKFHTPRNLLCALVGEVGELSEIFQWRGEVEPGLSGFSDEEKSHVAQELADILLYLVRLSDICGFDLGQAALNKLQMNAQKYPAELCRQKYDTPPRVKVEEESSGRKRQRERFTEDQVQAMTLLAERAQWSITAISWEERVKFCEDYGVTKERLSNFFNNRKPKEMKKGRSSRASLPQMHDTCTQATPLTGEDAKVHAQMQAIATQQVCAAPPSILMEVLRKPYLADISPDCVATQVQTLHTLQPVQHVQQLQVMTHPVVGMEHHMEHHIEHIEPMDHMEHIQVQHSAPQPPSQPPQPPQPMNTPAPA
ncbi:hypothetical protein BSKO_09348 [Bryopsis sp. KO-2023]|nr:hypothetical protein BSKO_09348 [Bryopsis sp. KO-2023]